MFVSLAKIECNNISRSHALRGNALPSTLCVEESDADLTNIGKSDVLQRAKAYLKDHGFKPSEVLEEAAKKGAPKDDDKDKPKTGGRTKAATQEPKPGDKKSDDKPTPPKDIDEWRAGRTERIAAFTGS